MGQTTTTSTTCLGGRWESARLLRVLGYNSTEMTVHVQYTNTTVKCTTEAYNYRRIFGGLPCRVPDTVSVRAKDRPGLPQCCSNSCVAKNTTSNITAKIMIYQKCKLHSVRQIA